MKQLSILICLISILSVKKQSAQNFNAYLAIGTNITDANHTNSGTSQVGTRIGVNLGPGVSFKINKKWKTSMEVLYSKNGFYINPMLLSNEALEKVVLHYAELPLTLDYLFYTKNKKYFYKYSISSGITYTRLFKHKIIALDGTDLTNDSPLGQKNALLFNFSATSFLSESFALSG